MGLEEDVKIEEDNPITPLRLSEFRRELREFRRKMKLIQKYPVKRGQSPPPCKPYEVLELVEKLEKDGLIQKPSYRLKY